MMENKIYNLARKIFRPFLPPFFTGEVPRRGDGGNNITLVQGEKLPPIERQEAPTSPVKNRGRKITLT